ncbi:hypothetical protein K461DRAFT_283855 [Myriangium duriaei CBS 260.36]|uniref:RRM domain-containing protein n=1 Tax=Myriangium duriaei CBS 260.36 TaxID=1168546 RepID=A0A9P4MJG1_9PEZI|nr:hypothetical protein K461DRAFT_283855 [Myriangium duriaei CBS 260.36]
MPNNTLYCSNLPDKLPKGDLKRALYMLFTTYGPVLDIVALKTPKMRGQAHVLFRDREASAQAMRALQDYDFFGKPMKIKYALTKSDTLAKLDGTYKQPQPRTDVPTTALQQSVFAGPPGTSGSSGPPGTNGVTTNGVGSAPPPGLSSAQSAASPATANTPVSQATKRQREESVEAEEEEDEGDAPMDMEEDGAAMEMSDED